MDLTDKSLILFCAAKEIVELYEQILIKTNFTVNKNKDSKLR
jgi:hypothetical protein